MTLIRRDPFAREELHGQRVSVSSGNTCDWCGRVKTTKTGKQYLYRYTVESDGGRKSTIGGLFCSVGCMRVYHE